MLENLFAFLRAVVNLAGDGGHERLLSLQTDNYYEVQHWIIKFWLGTTIRVVNGWDL